MVQLQFTRRCLMMLLLVGLAATPMRAQEEWRLQRFTLGGSSQFCVKMRPMSNCGFRSGKAAQLSPVRSENWHVFVLIRAGTRMTFQATNVVVNTPGAHQDKLLLAEPFQVLRVTDNAAMSAPVTTEADLKYEVQLGDSRIRVQELRLEMGTFSPCNIDNLHLDESSYQHDGRGVVVPERGRFTLILDIDTICTVTPFLPNVIVD